MFGEKEAAGTHALFHMGSRAQGFEFRDSERHQDCHPLALSEEEAELNLHASSAGFSFGRSHTFALARNK